LAKSWIVASEIRTGASVDKNSRAINPPSIAPTKNTRFQLCVFQSKSKNLVDFPRPAAEQIVLKFEENPKDCPKYNKKNMIAAIIMPENHQDHGCNINSIIFCLVV
jgi:hypothetical protein